MATNNALRMVDQLVWEQLNFLPVNSAAGSCIADDGERFIYYLVSATSFWRIDTWGLSTPQQLANPTGGTVWAGTNIMYLKQLGTQVQWVVYGSILAIITSGTGAPVYNKYDCATNVWSALSVANLPATFGTDGYLQCPEPAKNAYLWWYHSAVLNTITTTGATAGGTALPVTALPFALPSGAVLNFGTATAPLWAVTTASAAAAAVSITVAPLISTIVASTAYYYDDVFLVGNASTQMYRYRITTNVWASTSGNAGNPALPAITGAVGAGNSLRYTPGSGQANAENILHLIRGANTVNQYQYRLDTNAWSTPIIRQQNELISTWSTTTVRNDPVTKKQSKIILEKDATMRFYQLQITKEQLEPFIQQNLYPTGTALVGDRTCIIVSPDGIEELFMILHTSAAFVKIALSPNF